ncbi:similar to Saccharomyces cerevisiae YGL096W TOS8 Homeodomain-containing protein and putative transcription factor found associated with chromatin [Maudiozyma saulgeensis]|uniref:Similar to Saccharomyces cerevisiae YGL096W TOS8 Homeodomain-containing protein and putative transcription factor found associated with chromatin n=1 Tax=Maudiozyma saulgeensis TaxID=1789683 RepID=A0A1X7RBK6_9SACH|nr:similar to Saccharomyces cerevisiae YGL096W TOS8 Homeodomain-containing protein and putative transcription factor found associated with chromatin [Kazachstania saulgeensis]
MNSANTNIQLPSIKSLLNSIDVQPTVSEQPSHQDIKQKNESPLSLLASTSNDLMNKKFMVPISSPRPTLQPIHSHSHHHHQIPLTSQTFNSIPKLSSPPNYITTQTENSTPSISDESISPAPSIIKQDTPVESDTQIRRKSESMNKKTIDRRQSRSNLPKETIQVLNSWLLNHLNNPYPTAQEKRELLIKTGLTKIQLSNWFINVRRRKIFNDYYNLAKRQNDGSPSFHNDYVQDSGENMSTEVPLTRRKKLIDRLRELKKLTKEDE